MYHINFVTSAYFFLKLKNFDFVSHETYEYLSTFSKSMGVKVFLKTV